MKKNLILSAVVAVVSMLYFFAAYEYERITFAKTVILEVQTVPDASVYVDESFCGKTDSSGYLQYRISRKGTYSVNVKKNNISVFTRTVVFRSSEDRIMIDTGRIRCDFVFDSGDYVVAALYSNDMKNITNFTVQGGFNEDIDLNRFQNIMFEKKGCKPVLVKLPDSASDMLQGIILFEPLNRLYNKTDIRITRSKDSLGSADIFIPGKGSSQKIVEVEFKILNSEDDYRFSVFFDTDRKDLSKFIQVTSKGVVLKKLNRYKDTGRPSDYSAFRFSGKIQKKSPRLGYLRFVDGSRALFCTANTSAMDIPVRYASQPNFGRITGRVSFYIHNADVKINSVDVYEYSEPVLFSPETI